MYGRELSCLCVALVCSKDPSLHHSFFLDSLLASPPYPTLPASLAPELLHFPCFFSLIQHEDLTNGGDPAVKEEGGEEELHQLKNLLARRGGQWLAAVTGRRGGGKCRVSGAEVVCEGMARRGMLWVGEGGMLDATEHEEGKANWTQGRVGQSSPAKSAEVMSVMDGLASLYM